MTRNKVMIGVALAIAVRLGIPVVGHGAVPAALDCRPPAYVQRALRGAQLADLVRLGPPGDCVVDLRGSSRDPACFMGYRRAEAFRLSPDGVKSVSRMFSGRCLACVTTGSGELSRHVVGFDLAGSGGKIRVTLLLPPGAVEFEIPNGARFSAALSPAGLREWHQLIAAFASQASRPPEEFERDLARDAKLAPVTVAPDTSASRAAPALHPVVPDTPAVPIGKVGPRYPDIAREAGIDGTVVLSVLVGRDGRVHDSRVVKSIPALDAAATEAVLQWSFRPARRGGEAVDSWFEVPVRFSLH